MLTLLVSCAYAAPTPERLVLRALPDCDKVEAAVSEPVPVLLELAGTSLDAKVRERAATCLLERHPETAEEAISSWMREPARADLVALVLQRLDTLPEPVAVGVAMAGLRGPHADSVTPAVQGSDRPLVRATLMQDSD